MLFKVAMERKNTSIREIPEYLHVFRRHGRAWSDKHSFKSLIRILNNYGVFGAVGTYGPNNYIKSPMLLSQSTEVYTWKVGWLKHLKQRSSDSVIILGADTHNRMGSKNQEITESCVYFKMATIKVSEDGRILEFKPSIEDKVFSMTFSAFTTGNVLFYTPCNMKLEKEKLSFNISDKEIAIQGKNEYILSRKPRAFYILNQKAKETQKRWSNKHTIEDLMQRLKNCGGILYCKGYYGLSKGVRDANLLQKAIPPFKTVYFFNQHTSRTVKVNCIILGAEKKFDIVKHRETDLIVKKEYVYFTISHFLKQKGKITKYEPSKKKTKVFAITFKQFKKNNIFISTPLYLKARTKQLSSQLTAKCPTIDKFSCNKIEKLLQISPLDAFLDDVYTKKCEKIGRELIQHYTPQSDEKEAKDGQNNKYVHARIAEVLKLIAIAAQDGSLRRLVIEAIWKRIYEKG